MNSTLTNSTSWDVSIPVVLIISIHGVNFLLGLPLNVYIIIILFPSHGVMEAFNVFSWNQAISEIFFMVLGTFQILCNINYDLCIFEVVGFFLGICLSSRCLFQCCMCMEWYMAVVHPIAFLKYKPLRYRIACSISVWMCSLSVGVTYSCMLYNFPYTILTVIYIIILIVDLFCCVSILRMLRRPGQRNMERDVGEMNAAKRKAFRVVCVSLLAFLFQNVPLTVAFGIQNILSEQAFAVAAVIGLLVNTVAGILQSVCGLYRSGKLPLIQSRPLSSCCFSTG